MCWLFFRLVFDINEHGKFLLSSALHRDAHDILNVFEACFETFFRTLIPGEHSKLCAIEDVADADAVLFRHDFVVAVDVSNVLALVVFVAVQNFSSVDHCEVTPVNPRFGLVVCYEGGGGRLYWCGNSRFSSELFNFQIQKLYVFQMFLRQRFDSLKFTL